MKAKEFRDLSVEEVKQRIDELEEELFNLRFQAKLGQLANPLQLRMVRRDLARAKTILNQNNKTENKGNQDKS